MAPSVDDFVRWARQTLKELPPAIRNLAQEVDVWVEDFADEATLDALEIEEPFELTGVYQGVDLPRRSVFDPGPAVSTVRLFRRPILDEWASGDVELAKLVEHVVVHEFAHHFGFSDDEIHSIEES